MQGKVVFCTPVSPIFAGNPWPRLFATSPRKRRLNPNRNLVDHRWTENVVVAKARIPSTLRRALPEDRSEAKDIALEGIAVVKAAGNPLLFPDNVVNLEIPEICGRFCGASTNHFV